MIDKRDVQAFFDRLAPDWDAGMVRNEAVIARILDNAGVCEGCTVLDVACGTGVLFGDYVKRGAARVTAVDLSPEMAARAAEKAAGTQITVVCGDVEDSAAVRDSGPYDVVMVYNAFPHFPAQDVGRVDARGAFVVEGRIDHSDIRGCNLLVQ